MDEGPGRDDDVARFHLWSSRSRRPLGPSVRPVDLEEIFIQEDQLVILEQTFSFTQYAINLLCPDLKKSLVGLLSKTPADQSREVLAPTHNPSNEILCIKRLLIQAIYLTLI